jgi:hypothetical protein
MLPAGELEQHEADRRYRQFPGGDAPPRSEGMDLGRVSGSEEAEGPIPHYSWMNAPSGTSHAAAAHGLFAAAAARGSPALKLDSDVPNVPAWIHALDH